MELEDLKQKLPNITDPNLLKAMLEKGTIHVFESGKVILAPGQFVKMVPVVLEGAIKIMRMDEEGKELFLYHLEAGETCALSLTCCTASKPSEIRAVAEERTVLLGIPVQIHEQWTDEFKQWKEFVANTYQRRFQELLVALDAVAFKRMDERLMRYIVTKMKQQKSNELNTTHQLIANELGTSREVISRLLKQLEKKKWIELGRNVIYIRDDFEELISQ
ncbi:Crp/Fnr family transcriptional regulator [Rhodonellum psychrophilum GCM71 = DSM 17998]|uniref:Crp/Fnr family transcriptional regulator n=2 Tax=Rhodonellum TaxID=336827 RepID=U5C8K6_9BACT|nr:MULTISPECIES: Crp/Fnr family transcriptional regulator [Rhodonellum]ERM84532.1 Crp/Fnr family transcriptional regulator [Rhodonellum psychrophilum GCM71 = DSM 17998]SDY84458.1 CRP/FNR family transcriptional regulator, anaerobic regulatory protein [Rhodonellum ikkaensis]